MIGGRKSWESTMTNDDQIFVDEYGEERHIMDDWADLITQEIDAEAEKLGLPDPKLVRENKITIIIHDRGSMAIREENDN